MNHPGTAPPTSLGSIWILLLQFDWGLDIWALRRGKVRWHCGQSQEGYVNCVFHPNVLTRRSLRVLCLIQLPTLSFSCLVHNYTNESPKGERQWQVSPVHCYALKSSTSNKIFCTFSLACRCALLCWQVVW